MQDDLQNLEQIRFTIEGWLGEEVEEIVPLSKTSTKVTLECKINRECFMVYHLLLPEEEDFFNSYQKVKQLKHPNIIVFYDCFIAKDFAIILLEKIGINLLSYVEKHDKGLNEKFVQYVIYNVTNLLLFLHENNIAHLDICAQNIYISSSGVIKLGGFGKCKKLQKNTDRISTNYFLNRTLYLAPECLSKDLFNPFAADVWSLGILMHVLLTSNWPFCADNNEELFVEAASGNINLVKFASSFPKLLVLIDSLLDNDPSFRPALANMLKNGWVVTGANFEFSADCISKQPTAQTQNQDAKSHKECSIKHLFNKLCKKTNNKNFIVSL